MFNPVYTKLLFMCFFFKEKRVYEQRKGKMDERIFMIFFGKGHETMKNLKHFGEIALNPFNPGSIISFSGSVFVSYIMENGKRIYMTFSICQTRHEK